MLMQKRACSKSTATHRRLASIALILCASPVSPLTAQSAMVGPVPVDIEVPLRPTPVMAEGKLRLLYELHVTNFGGTALALTRVTVAGNNPTALADLQGTQLAGSFAALTPAARAGGRNVILGGARAIVFLLVSVDSDTAPVTMRHRLAFESVATADAAGGAAGPPTEQFVNGPVFDVPRPTSLVLGPPLRGRWIAGNGLSNETGHRRSLIALDGRARIAQRFATDWVALGADGKLTRAGEVSRNADYYGYGAEAMAVAAAVVVATTDGIPENTPQVKQRAVPITLETIAGNNVVLDLGGGRYALYAHLQPGRLAVKRGDRVRAGQVIGYVGNSGNSDLPHLHFQVMDGPSPLGSEGVPYLLGSFRQEGVAFVGAALLRDGFRSPIDGGSDRHDELPVQNALVAFP